MASKIWPVLKLATKVTVAGGALYVAYDSGLLGSSEQGTEVLGKAKSAIPPAVNEWLKYFGMEECGQQFQRFRMGPQKYATLPAKDSSI
ncbi:hypothetical protein CRUP_000630 [Coryphaenoides rupestris]|nr:hypothetical protein CRUP_000630 [Coryphaenoides rupestris]